MSTFTWGKLKFSKKPEDLKDFVFENSPIYFSNKRLDLFVTNLSENEIYFNAALGQEKLMDLSKYGGYLNDDENYFFVGMQKNLQAKMNILML